MRLFRNKSGQRGCLKKGPILARYLPQSGQNLHLKKGGEMSKQPSKTIEVTEYLAAALLKAQGIRFLGAKGEAGRRVGLVFDDEGGRAAALLDQHLNGGVQVNSADFAAAIRTVKDSIFGARRG